MKHISRTSCLGMSIGALLLCGSMSPAWAGDNADAEVDLQCNQCDSLDRQLDRLLREAAPGKEGKRFFVLPRSNDLNKIPQDPKNPLTPEKVRLGKLLYHETALANTQDCVLPKGEETYSCASCHFAQAGFKSNLPQGIGEGGGGFGSAGEARGFRNGYETRRPSDHGPDVQPIASPTILNGAYQELMLWNGQFGGVGDNADLLPQGKTWEAFGFPLEANALGLHGLETQAIAGMQVHRMKSIDTLHVLHVTRYKKLFERAFPQDKNPITHHNAALAIASFERTVLANEAPWQKYVKGDRGAMTNAQKRGALVFFDKGKGNCHACHTGPALNSMSFHALGMNDLDGTYLPGKVELGVFPEGTVPDDVRQLRGGLVRKVTGDEARGEQDDYKVKTPQLYNLMDSPFYGHGASFATVEEVVRYKNQAQPESIWVDRGHLSPLFVPLGLSENEISDLVAFLEGALYDPNLMRYVPRVLPSGNCAPVNDPRAQLDLSAGGFCR